MEYGFLGSCDRLRLAGNEGKWQKMMRLAQPISMEQFRIMCDVAQILDEDETLEDYVEAHFDADPDSGFYKSFWGNQPCMFLQTHGFEFIFVNLGKQRTYFRKNPDLTPNQKQIIFSIWWIRRDLQHAYYVDIQQITQKIMTTQELNRNLGRLQDMGYIDSRRGEYVLYNNGKEVAWEMLRESQNYGQAPPRLMRTMDGSLYY